MGLKDAINVIDERGKVASYQKIDEKLIFDINLMRQFLALLRLLRGSSKTLYCEFVTLSSLYHKIQKKLGKKPGISISSALFIYFELKLTKKKRIQRI